MFFLDEFFFLLFHNPLLLVLENLFHSFNERNSHPRCDLPIGFGLSLFTLLTFSISPELLNFFFLCFLMLIQPTHNGVFLTCFVGNLFFLFRFVYLRIYNIRVDWQRCCIVMFYSVWVFFYVHTQTLQTLYDLICGAV